MANKPEQQAYLDAINEPKNAAEWEMAIREPKSWVHRALNNIIKEGIAEEMRVIELFERYVQEAIQDKAQRQSNLENQLAAAALASRREMFNSQQPTFERQPRDLSSDPQRLQQQVSDSINKILSWREEVNELKMGIASTKQDIKTIDQNWMLRQATEAAEQASKYVNALTFDSSLSAMDREQVKAEKEARYIRAYKVTPPGKVLRDHPGIIFLESLANEAVNAAKAVETLMTHGDLQRQIGVMMEHVHDDVQAAVEKGENIASLVLKAAKETKHKLSLNPPKLGAKDKEETEAVVQLATKQKKLKHKKQEIEITISREENHLEDTLKQQAMLQSSPSLRK